MQPERTDSTTYYLTWPGVKATLIVPIDVLDRHDDLVAGSRSTHDDRPRRRVEVSRRRLVQKVSGSAGFRIVPVQAPNVSTTTRSPVSMLATGGVATENS
jgi:hypothetical protein